jgi:hypothetical protein
MDLAPPEPPRTNRSPGKWLVLLVVWAAGLLMWILYVIAVGYLVFRFLL